MAAPVKRSGERGAGWLTLVVFGSIIGVVGYLAYNVLPFYYYYYELQNQFEATIRTASMETDVDIRRRLTRRMQEMEIPADPEDLLIERDGGRMRIRLKYTEVFRIPWGDEDREVRRFDFDAYAEGDIQ
jgi:Domain of unknown function (DUF4845)